MKWIPVIILTCMAALWCLQCLLKATAERDEAYKAMMREKVEEVLRKKAS